VNFWDTSALVPLFIREEQTEPVTASYAEQKHILVAHHAVTECASAFCRLGREEKLTASQLSRVLDTLREEASRWHRVDMSPALERMAIRCLRVHTLRAMDALHLASALLIAEGDPSICSFYTLDTRLKMAVEKEGFILKEFT